MQQVFGDFIESDGEKEYLVMRFSPTAVSLQLLWRNNGLSADFVAEYWATFFANIDTLSPQRQLEIKGTINYLANGSSLGTTSIKYSYKFPENGDYYLVFDNTDVPKGGGSPTNQVEINLKVSVVTPVPTEQPKTSGFEAILAVFVIFVLIMWKK